MEILQTERLILRHIEISDAEFMREMMNEPAFIRNVADRGIRTTADAANYIEQKIAPSYREFRFGFYLIELKEGRVPIGICGLVKRETLEDVDIGYSTLERYWGKGYAFEAALAVMDYGRTVLGLQKIVAITAPHNISSINLLEKLGLRFEKMIQMPGYETESKLFV